MSRSNNSVFVIAEVGQAHDGSLGTAHAYIDAAGKAGANAVKFQTHIASAESTPSEPWRIKFSKQDKSRYDYWKRMEFSREQWAGLKEHCEEIGIEFMSSPFSIEAAIMLMEIGIKYWKIASGEVNNKPLFQKISATGLPVFLSTGMSAMEEIDRAVELLEKGTDDITVMQCISMYPTPLEKTGLNMIQYFKERYNCKSGLSDHSGTIYAGLAAAALGADAIEVHLTLSKDSFGPDIPVSLTVDELSVLSRGIKDISIMLNNPVNKDEMALELQGMRELFNKSIVAKQDMPKGTELTEEKLAFKKPGTGLSPEKVESILGKITNREISRDEIISLSDIE